MSTAAGTAQPISIENPDWAPGALVGRYTLLTRLAMGGMAEIWLARQAGMKGFEKVVVIKRILDTYCQDQDFVEMFLDEARIAAQLTHPNIVQIYDLGEHAGAYYIAMEYLSGEMLSRVVRAGIQAARPLPYPFAARLLASAAEGLGYAHSRTGLNGQPLNIVHRDVSPQNLMVTYDGIVKVLDFGIAKASGRVTRTEVGKFKGKTSYMAPEQLRSSNVDARADVFALGVVLWEILARARLFHFQDPMKALQALLSDVPVVSPATRNPEAPEALCAIALRALERDVNARYQSAGDFQYALEEWLRTQPDAPTTREVSDYLRDLFADRIALQARLVEQARSEDVLRVRPPTETSGSTSMPGSRTGQQSPRQRVGLWAGLAVALLAVAGTGAFVVLGGRTAPEPRVLELPAMVLEAPEPTLLEIATDPPGALIALDGEPRGPSPLTLEDLEVGTHRVVASLEGHVSAEREVTVASQGQQLSVFLQLARVPPAIVVAPVTPPVQAGPARPVAARGKLTLTTIPWTEVYLGSRKLGETPLVDVTLPAGRHQLRLVNKQKGIDQQVPVEIKPGQSTALRRTFK